MGPADAIKILSFRNCELHCCHLDGYKKQREAFLKRLTDIEKFFIEKPAANKFRIWYNVDETSLDEALIAQVAASIARMQGHIVKIALIGVGRMGRWRLTKKLKTSRLPVPYAYFSDAERAKEWLV